MTRQQHQLERQRQAELCYASVGIAAARCWALYRGIPRTPQGMDHASPEYRHWRRQAAGHAFIVAALRALREPPAAQKKENPD